MRPVVGGASHASQDSATVGFGLGSAPFGTLEVAWPGGVRNRLYRVRDGESVLFPEIPCSYDTDVSFLSYFRCVHRSIAELSSEKVLSSGEAVRFFASALIAYVDN